MLQSCCTCYQGWWQSRSGIKPIEYGHTTPDHSAQFCGQLAASTMPSGLCPDITRRAALQAWLEICRSYRSRPNGSSTCQEWMTRKVRGKVKNRTLGRHLPNYVPHRPVQRFGRTWVSGDYSWVIKKRLAFSTKPPGYIERARTIYDKITAFDSSLGAHVRERKLTFLDCLLTNFPPLARICTLAYQMWRRFIRMALLRNYRQVTWARFSLVAPKLNSWPTEKIFRHSGT